MKRLTISLLGAVLIGMPAFAAMAQTAGQAAAAQDNPATQSTQDEAKKASVNDHICLRHTGSRIQRRADKKDGSCLDAYGRAYTRDDIDRTGETDLADALRKLDPSIH
jgi:hypothetical protein